MSLGFLRSWERWVLLRDTWPLCGCLISPVGSAGAELQEGTLEGQGDSCPQRAVTMSCQEN